MSEQEEFKQNKVNWKGIFRYHSWWYDPGKKRSFIIVERWWDDNSELEAVELLAVDSEVPVKIPIAEMIAFFKQGLLTVASNDPVGNPQ